MTNRSRVFPIHRGTNISHWLSQSRRRGTDRLGWFTEADVRRIADWGFDHIRLPIDEEQMWDEQGRQDPGAFELLDSALDWAEAAGLGVVVDLHILRSHSFGQATEPRLFTDPVEGEKFAGLWRELSARLGHRSNDRVAYELMNEAVAKDPEDWNRVAMQAYRAIRVLEPERVIVLGSNQWNSAFTFDSLTIPDDPNTVLTFHFYHPMFVTHHRASWSVEGRMYDGPVRDPGSPIAPDNLHLVRPPEAHRLVVANLDDLNKPYDRSSMARDFAQPLVVSRKSGHQLYCGEFGVVDYVPMDVRSAWYRDIISVFDEFGIGWANWDYKGQFGIVDYKGMSTGIAEVMLESAMEKPAL